MDGEAVNLKTAICTGQHKYSINADIHASSGYVTHDHNVWALEDITWPRGYCGRHRWNHETKHWKSVSVNIVLLKKIYNKEILYGHRLLILL
jgi:hypothetical protein